MVNKIFDYIFSDPIFGSKPNGGDVPLMMTVVSFILICAIVAKLIFDRYSSIIYYTLVLLFGYGAGKLHGHLMTDDTTVVTVSSILPRIVVKIVMPIVLYSAAIRLENIKFLNIAQIMRVVTVGLVLHSLYFITLLIVIHCTYHVTFLWENRTTLILCLCIKIFQPELAIEKLEAIGGHVKYLQALLKAELLWQALFAFTTVDCIMKCAQLDIDETTKTHRIVDMALLTLLQFAGVTIGAAYGLLVQLLYQYAYNSEVISSLISFPLCFLIYSSAELLHTSGCAAVSSYSIVVTILKKPKMHPDNDRFGKQLWRLVHFFTVTYVLGLDGFVLGAINKDHDFRMICFAIGVFVTSVMLRLLYSFLLLPYLYGGQTKWTEVALTVVGPYRGLGSLILALRFASEDTDEGYQVVINVTLVVLMSLFLNVVLLEWFLKRLDVYRLSKLQISNMTVAVEQINKCRGNMIFAEQLDRIVADANWSVVHKITNFSHPYKDRIKSSQFGEVLKEDVKTVECPRCGAWSIAPPTRKELDEITKETRLRVMKAQQVSYIQQRDAGTLTAYGYKFLSNLIYQASYSNEISLNTDDLRIVADDLKCVKKMESFFQNIYTFTSEKYDWQPANPFRLKCYNMVTSQSFKITMAVTSLIDMFLCLCILYFYIFARVTVNKINYWPKYAYVLGWIVSTMSPIFYLVNVMESVIQVLGLGLMQYFSRKVYVIEFFSCIIMRTVQLSLFLEQLSTAGAWMNILDCEAVVVYMNSLMLLRFTRFYIFFVSLIPYILLRIRKTIDEDLLKRYDIGKAYLVGLDRVLKYLNQLTTNEQVLDEIRKEVETNRQKVTKELSIIQKEHPTIAITVKTKHAIRHVINSMSNCAEGMLDEGILDNIENSAFSRSISKIRARLYQLNVIVPPSPINIVKEIPWLVGDDENTEVFLTEAQMSNYDYNDVLIRNGDDPVGLYILVSGLLKASYVPSPTTVQLAAKFGVVPNYDFFENFKFDQPQEEFIVSGNVVGELGVVTGRRYDMTVIAETAVQVYYIPWYVMKNLHETHSGQQLLMKIWKKVAVKISVTLLKFTSTYRQWSSERLMTFLQKGILTNVAGYVAINLDHRVEEAIIIEGVAMDLNNQKIIYGPYRIPKTVTKLLFPDHHAWGFQTVYETRMFMILITGTNVEALFEVPSTPRMPSESEGSIEAITQQPVKKKKVDRSRKVGFTEEPSEDGFD